MFSSSDRRARPPVSRSARGFTLIEMIVTVGIFAILATLGVPTMRETVLNQRVKTATFDLYSSLIFARGEAIKRNANVDIAPAGGGWANGWTVQAGVTMLKTQGPLIDMTLTGPGAFITYRRDGRLANGAATLTIDVAGGSNVTMRCIAIALDGRPNIALDHNNNGNCADG